MKLKRPTTILLILIGVVVTIAFIVISAYVCETGWFSAAVYRYTGSGRWLYSALYHGVQNGNTIEQVEKLLGPGKQASDNVRKAVKKLAQRHQQSDGYEESDQVLGFPLPGGQLYLQFRNGVLINFEPTDFQKYSQPQIIG